PAAVLPPPPKTKTPPAPVQPEPEFELAQDYELVITPEPLVPAHDQRPPAPPAAAKPPAPASLSADQFLADQIGELDGLGLDNLAPGVPPSSAPAAPPAPVQAPPP